LNAARGSQRIPTAIFEMESGSKVLPSTRVPQLPPHEASPISTLNHGLWPFEIRFPLLGPKYVLFVYWWSLGPMGLAGAPGDLF
jgi:hypothetical protein